MPVVVRSMFSGKSLLATVLLLGFSFFSPAVAQTPRSASIPSSVALTFSPTQAVVDAGSLVTLVASVSAEGTPVRHGVVLFCDASAPVCEDSAVLGKAQLTSSGTASVKLKLGAGVYAIKAVFQSTPASRPAVQSGASAIARFKVATIKTSSI